MTDAATSAIGATVGVYVISQILDAISQLGQIRYAFPTHYLSAWRDMFVQNRYPSDMLVGRFSSPTSSSSEPQPACGFSARTYARDEVVAKGNEAGLRGQRG